MKQAILDKYYHILWRLAKKYIQKHKPFVIGVNGSVGKTSCRMIVMQTLQKFLPHKVVYTSSKNFNGELWFPLSIFCVDAFIPTIYHFIYTFFHAIGSLWYYCFRIWYWSSWRDVFLITYCEAWYRDIYCYG